VVLRPGSAGSYSLTLVFPDGRVVGPVTARLRTVQPAAGAAPATLPVVSTSASRVYYLDGDADIRFLGRDGATGIATRVPGSVHSESAFAVSPDDTRIAVATLDASSDAASMRLSVEDLAGGGNHVDLPAPTDAAVWPVGWRGGDLVLALGSVPTRNSMGTSRAHVPDAERSTGMITTPSGTGKSSTGLPASASFMKVVQIGTATREPVSSLPRLLGRS